MHYQVLLGVLLAYAHFHLVMDGAIPILIGLVSTAAFNYALARILGFKFNFLAFLFYYFIYLPVWLALNLVVGVGVLFNVKWKLDWKVAKS